MISIDYVARRLGIFLIVVFLAVTINFAIPRLLPGDPVESAINRIVALGGGSIGDVEAMAASYNAKFGLDKPVVDQYFSYWNDLLHGDLGVSLTLFPATVWSIMRTALLWTIGLLGTSVIISFVIGLTMGGVMAWPSAPKSLRKIVPIFMVTSAVPSFLLAIVLLFVFAISFQVFPSGGGFRFGALIRWDFSTIAMILKHATLPALSIILTSVGFWAISTRGLLVSNLGEDYILHAEARGLRQRRIFLWYGMRNSWPGSCRAWLACSALRCWVSPWRKR